MLENLPDINMELNENNNDEELPEEVLRFIEFCKTNTVEFKREGKKKLVIVKPILPQNTGCDDGVVSGEKVFELKRNGTEVELVPIATVPVN